VAALAHSNVAAARAKLAEECIRSEAELEAKVEAVEAGLLFLPAKYYDDGDRPRYYTRRCNECCRYGKVDCSVHGDYSSSDDDGY